MSNMDDGQNIFRRLKLRWRLGMLGLAALIFFGACAFLRISSTSDLEAYAGMAARRTTIRSRRIAWSVDARMRRQVGRDGATFQVLCADQSGRGTVGEVIDATVAAPFVNHRRIVGGRNSAGDALSPLSSRFDEAISDCGCGLLRRLRGEVEGIAAGRYLDDDVAADILVFARIGRTFDSFGDVGRERCCSVIVRGLLPADFSPEIGRASCRERG